MIGLLFCALGLLFGLVIYVQLKNSPVHRTMLEISELIYETCKTYLITQGKFILLLWALHRRHHLAVLWLSGAGGESSDRGDSAHHSGVFAGRHRGQLWRGVVRDSGQHLSPTLAPPSRVCAESHIQSMAIPLKAGMSIGMLLISVELLIMLSILLFIPRDYAGPASSASPSANRWAPRPCASQAASLPRSPTSAPT
jgi:K(+)-stimulated pyrophosphate-energized sodium pump